MTFWDAEAETLPRERLEARALERMRATRARLGGHAGWRRRLGGVSPHDVKALEDCPEIRVCAPGEIERPQGKAVRVVDRRGVSR